MRAVASKILITNEYVKSFFERIYIDVYADSNAQYDALSPGHVDRIRSVDGRDRLSVSFYVPSLSKKGRPFVEFWASLDPSFLCWDVSSDIAEQFLQKTANDKKKMAVELEKSKYRNSVNNNNITAINRKAERKTPVVETF